VYRPEAGVMNCPLPLEALQQRGCRPVSRFSRWARRWAAGCLERRRLLAVLLQAALFWRLPDAIAMPHLLVLVLLYCMLCCPAPSSTLQQVVDTLRHPQCDLTQHTVLSAAAAAALPAWLQPARSAPGAAPL
jgi:hypothetical protein